MADDIFAAAQPLYRRAGQGGNVYPIRQDHDDAAGMDDVPFAPLDAYGDMGSEAAPATSGRVIVPGAKSKALTFTRIGDLELKEPEFHVDGMIETETVGVLFGDPGCGKSFLAVDLACSVASGLGFHGRKVRQGSVFYIAGEGHNGLARRFNAWARHHGQDIKGLPVFKSNRAAQLLDSASAKDVESAVLGLSAMHGDPALIIIDTLARNFGPGDENSTQDMSGFVAAIDDLRANWPKTTIIIVHHSGLADKGRGRGNSALKGALDFEFGAAKDGETITLSNPKMKEATELPDLFFTLTDVELGPRMKSAVLVASDAPEKAAPRLKGQALIAMQAFADAVKDHGTTKGGEDFPSNRKCVSLEHWREACDRHALTDGSSDSAARQAFGRAWKSLQEKGEIRVLDGFAWRCRDA